MKIKFNLKLIEIEPKLFDFERILIIFEYANCKDVNKSIQLEPNGLLTKEKFFNTARQAERDFAYQLHGSAWRLYSTFGKTKLDKHNKDLLKQFENAMKNAIVYRWDKKPKKYVSVKPNEFEGMNFDIKVDLSNEENEFEGMNFDIKVDLSNTVPMSKEEIEGFNEDIKYFKQVI